MDLPVAFDEDALFASIDVIGRSGAKDFELGYDDTANPMTWYAQAKYRGARLAVDGLSGPVEAAEALARKVISGGMCTHCGKTVSLSRADKKKFCRWTRNGKKWERGCGK